MGPHIILYSGPPKNPGLGADLFPIRMQGTIFSVPCLIKFFHHKTMTRAHIRYVPIFLQYLIQQTLLLLFSSAIAGHIVFLISSKHD